MERGLIGPYLFENHDGHACSVNSERYIAMLREFFFLQNPEKREMWMRQGGAIAHTAKASLDTFKAKFSDGLISQKT